MAILQARPLTWQDTNPLGMGISQGLQQAQSVQDLQKGQLANALARIQNQYAPQMQQAELGYKQAQIPHLNAQTGLLSEQTKWYGPKAQSDLQDALSHRGLMGSQQRQIDYLLEHPGFMGGEEAKTLEALKAMGLLDFNNLQQGGMQQRPMPSPQGQENPIPQYLRAPGQPSQMPNMPPPMGQNAGPMGSEMPPLPGQQQQQSGNSGLFNTGNQLVDSILNKGMINQQQRQQQMHGYSWAHTPIDAKNHAVATLSGAGVDPATAANLLASGQTVPQVMEQLGLGSDPNKWPDPLYPATKGDITKINQRRAALAEIQPISEFVTTGLAEYLPGIGNMSLSQVKDVMGGMNKDRQMKFLAAYGLMPELTNLRIGLAGGKAGITAQKEMQEATYGHMRPLQQYLDKDVFIGAQRLMDKELSNAFDKANKAITNVGRKGKEETKEESDPLGIL